MNIGMLAPIDKYYQAINETILAAIARKTACSSRILMNRNARIEHEKALSGVIISLTKDDTELFKQFSDKNGWRCQSPSRRVSALSRYCSTIGASRISSRGP
ncbi:hypothetical protein GFL85_13830 [Rhizobium laguerreae]|nr:hypothetical protein [Rhizobium laguerreae]